MERYYDLEPGDEEFPERCLEWGEGYMVPTFDWYQCSECGAEAPIDDYGMLWFTKQDSIRI